MAENQAVTNFREYLRIKTVQPDPDYDSSTQFLKRQAKELDLPIKVYKTWDNPHREVLVMTWEGTEPNLPSLLLNSHTDVVPVYPEHWKHDAFGAVKDDNGDIYARGTQDMKSVGIQYLEAIRRLKKSGKQCKRTVHLTFVPDEEIGGKEGMDAFLPSKDFTDLSIGFALDEGLANPTDAFTVFYGERSPWWVAVTAKGKPGHGSRFIEDTAAEKIRRVINSFLDFRAEEEKRLKNHTEFKLGDVTTVNLTKLQGGIQTNVVPDQFKASFDIRIPPTVDLVSFEDKIKNWCNEAGPDVSYDFEQKFVGDNMTCITDGNIWWTAFSEACKHMDMQLETEIFPAATDSRFLRKAGYKCIGFSPMNRTPILLHDHNEFLNEAVFLRGIDVYEGLIPALANC